jgi:hypothetical protein
MTCAISASVGSPQPTHHLLGTRFPTCPSTSLKSIRDHTLGRPLNRSEYHSAERRPPALAPSSGSRKNLKAWISLGRHSPGKSAYQDDTARGRLEGGLWRRGCDRLCQVVRGSLKDQGHQNCVVDFGNGTSEYVIGLGGDWSRTWATSQTRACSHGRRHGSLIPRTTDLQAPSRLAGGQCR